MSEKLLDLEEFKEQKLEEGIDKDYGKIPNVKKPCLLLPGAQKIAKYYGYTHAFEIQEAVENHEERFYFYRVICRVMFDNGSITAIIGDMIGSCSTHDSGKAKAPPNSILKMAEKRAYVSAVLYVVAGSGLFSADVEDMDKEELTGSADGIKWFASKWSNGFCGACQNKHIDEGQLVSKIDGKWMAKDCYEHLRNVEGASTPEEETQEDKFRETLEQMERDQLEEQAYTLADTTHNRIAVNSLEKMGDREIIDLIMEMRK